MIWLLLLIPLGYLWGAIPWGLLIAKLSKGVDVRQYGSGKTGTTNVIRTAGVKAGLAVLVADLAKAAIGVLLVSALFGNHALEAATGLAILVGHNWSLFIQFQGGRGTAPGLGGLLAISPLAGLATFLTGVPALLLSRYVSLGSMAGASTGAIASLVLALVGRLPWESASYALIGVPIVLYQHRANVKRLLQGTEHRLGQAGVAIHPLKAQGTKE